jgi:predicted SprT family Zn-dependent metalloprotease
MATLTKKAPKKKAPVTTNKRIALKSNTIKTAAIVPLYDTKTAPTATQYISLQEAFSHFNKTLFNNELPPVLVTFQRQPKSYGYYWPDKLISRVDGARMAEIALAINTFDARSDEQIFSTLVHEMVHHWQQIFGKPSRNGYHNKEWANKMKEVGLYPSTTGLEGGDETGQSCSHYIMEHGTFKHHSTGLAASIDWNSAPDIRNKKKTNKAKYTCPCCDSNVWGKPELNINCGDCNVTMISDYESESEAA